LTAIDQAQRQERDLQARLHSADTRNVSYLVPSGDTSDGLSSFHRIARVRARGTSIS
jgi:hypothetical protein